MIKKTVLENGIQIISEKIPQALSCSLSIWVNAGSANETVLNNGVSHFIEHIVFKGSKTKTALEIAEESENVGANLNAFTDRENTCFHTVVLPEYVLTPLELFLDVIFSPRLDQNDIELERQVILEEIKMYKDTPEDLVQDKLYEIIWTNHSMGRPITGTMETIINMKTDSIKEFLNDFYTPDNIVISIAGDFDLDKIVNKVNELTKNQKKKAKKIELEPLIYSSNIYVEEKEVEQTYISFASKGTSIFDEERYALAVLDIAIGSGNSSRLFQEIREKRGLAYSISSYYQTNRLGGLFGIYAATTGKDMNQVVKLILHELENVKKHGLKKDELERAKMQLRTGLLIELESSKVRSFRNALYQMYYEKFLTTEEINKSILAITNNDIIKLCEDIFNKRYFNLVVVGSKEELTQKRKEELHKQFS